MSSSINVNLSVTADTAKAKAQLEQLQSTLQKLSVESANLKVGVNANEIQKASLAATELAAHLKQATNASTGTLDFSKFNQSITSSGMTLQKYGDQLLKLGPQGQQSFQQLAQAVAQSEIPVKRLSNLFGQFGQTLKNAIGWQVSSSIIHGVMGSMQHAFTYAQQLNESLNKIQIVTQQSDAQMAKFAETANQAAKALSTTTTSYTDAALIYYQQGLSAKEVQERTDVTIKMANAAGVSAKVVSDQLTAVWNNFADGSHQLEYYADVMTALGAATASSTDEISKGLEKFASVADTVGLSYENAAAALATITATTRQSADSVGTGLRTLFARFQSVKLGETLEDGVDLTKYSKALEAVGVRVLDANGELRTMDDLLEDLGGRWQNLNSTQKTALSQTIGGIRQYTNLIALMDNFDFYKQNQQTALNSAGTVQKQADIYAKSWEAAQKRVKASSEAIYSDLINDDFFIGLNDSLAKLLDTIDSIIDRIGGLKGVLLSLGSIGTSLFSTQIGNGLYKFGSSLGGLFTDQNKVRSDFVKRAANMLTAGKETYAIDKYTKGEQSLVKKQLLLQDSFAKNSAYMSPIQKLTAQMSLDNYNQAIGNYRQYGAQARLASAQEGTARASLVNSQIRPNRDSSELKFFNQSFEHDLVEPLKQLEKASQVFDNFKDMEYSEQGVKQFANALKATKAFNDAQVADYVNQIKEAPEEIKSTIDTFSQDISKQKQEKFNDFTKQQEINTNTKEWTNTQKAVEDRVKAEVKAEQEKAKADSAALNARTAITAKGLMQTAQGLADIGAAGISLMSTANNIKQIDEAVRQAKDGTVEWSEAWKTIGVNSASALAQGGMGISSLVSGLSALGVASGPLLAAFAAIAAVATIAIPLYQQYKELTREETDTEKLDRLTKETEQARTRAQEAKQAYNDLISQAGSHNELLNTIGSLTEGTLEFKEALLEANQLAKQMIDANNLQYGRDYYYDDKSIIRFKEGAIERAQEQNLIYYENADKLATTASLIQNAADIRTKRDTTADSLWAFIEDSEKLTDEGIINLLNSYGDNIPNKNSNESKWIWDQWLDNFLTKDMTQKYFHTASQLLSGYLQNKDSFENFQDYYDKLNSDEAKEAFGGLLKYNAQDRAAMLETFGIDKSTYNYFSGKTQEFSPEAMESWLQATFNIDSIEDYNAQLEKEYKDALKLLAKPTQDFFEGLAGSAGFGDNVFAKAVGDQLAELYDPETLLNLSDTILDEYFGENGYTLGDLKLIYQEHIGSIMGKTDEEIINATKQFLINERMTDDFNNTLNALYDRIASKYANTSKMSKDAIMALKQETVDITGLDEATAKIAQAAKEQADKQMEQQYVNSIVDFLNAAPFLQTGTAEKIAKDSEKYSIEDFEQLASYATKFSSAFGDKAAAGMLDAMVDKLHGSGSKELGDALASLKLTGNNIEDLFSLKNLVNNKSFTQKTHDDLQELYTLAFQDMGGGNVGLFEALYGSEEFADGLKTLRKEFKKTGEISGESIAAMAEESEWLAMFLEDSAFNAESLADVLTMLELGDIGIEDLSDQLIEAVSSANALENSLALMYANIDNFQVDRSIQDVGKFYKGLADNVEDAWTSGMWLDKPALQSWEELFGTESMLDYRNFVEEINGDQDLTAEEVDKAINERFKKEQAAMAAIQKNGNLLSLWQYYDENGNDEKDIFSYRNGDVTVANIDKLKAENLDSIENFINYLHETVGMTENTARAMANELIATNANLNETFRKAAVEESIGDLLGQDKTRIQIDEAGNIIGKSTEGKGEQVELHSKSGEVISGDYLRELWKKNEDVIKESFNVKTADEFFNKIIKQAQELGMAFVDLGKDFDYVNATEDTINEALSSNTLNSYKTLDDYLKAIGAENEDGIKDVKKLAKAYEDLGFSTYQAYKQIDDEWRKGVEEGADLTQTAETMADAFHIDKETEQWQRFLKYLEDQQIKASDFSAKNYTDFLNTEETRKQLEDSAEIMANAFQDMFKDLELELKITINDQEFLEAILSLKGEAEKALNGDGGLKIDGDTSGGDTGEGSGTSKGTSKETSVTAHTDTLGSEIPDNYERILAAEEAAQTTAANTGVSSQIGAATTLGAATFTNAEMMAQRKATAEGIAKQEAHEIYQRHLNDLTAGLATSIQMATDDAAEKTAHYQQTISDLQGRHTSETNRVHDIEASSEFAAGFHARAKAASEGEALLTQKKEDLTTQIDTLEAERAALHDSSSSASDAKLNWTRWNVEFGSIDDLKKDIADMPGQLETGIEALKQGYETQVSNIQPVIDEGKRLQAEAARAQEYNAAYAEYEALQDRRTQGLEVLDDFTTNLTSNGFTKEWVDSLVQAVGRTVLGESTLEDEHLFDIYKQAQKEAQREDKTALPYDLMTIRNAWFNASREPVKPIYDEDYAQAYAEYQEKYAQVKATREAGQQTISDFVTSLFNDKFSANLVNDLLDVAGKIARGDELSENDQKNISDYEEIRETYQELGKNDILPFSIEDIVTAYLNSSMAFPTEPQKKEEPKTAIDAWEQWQTEHGTIEKLEETLTASAATLEEDITKLTKSNEEALQKKKEELARGEGFYTAYEEAGGEEGAQKAAEREAEIKAELDQLYQARDGRNDEYNGHTLDEMIAIAGDQAKHYEDLATQSEEVAKELQEQASASEEAIFAARDEAVSAKAVADEANGLVDALQFLQDVLIASGEAMEDGTISDEERTSILEKLGLSEEELGDKATSCETLLDRFGQRTEATTAALTILLSLLNSAEDQENKKKGNNDEEGTEEPEEGGSSKVEGSATGNAATPSDGEGTTPEGEGATPEVSGPAITAENTADAKAALSYWQGQSWVSDNVYGYTKDQTSNSRTDLFVDSIGRRAERGEEDAIAAQSAMENLFGKPLSEVSTDEWQGFLNNANEAGLTTFKQDEAKAIDKGIQGSSLGDQVRRDQQHEAEVAAEAEAEAAIEDNSIEVKVDESSVEKAAEQIEEGMNSSVAEKTGEGENEGETTEGEGEGLTATDLSATIDELQNKVATLKSDVESIDFSSVGSTAAEAAGQVDDLKQSITDVKNEANGLSSLQGFSTFKEECGAAWKQLEKCHDSLVTMAQDIENLGNTSKGLDMQPFTKGLNDAAAVLTPIAELFGSMGADEETGEKEVTIKFTGKDDGFKDLKTLYEELSPLEKTVTAKFVGSDQGLRSLKAAWDEIVDGATKTVTLIGKSDGGFGNGGRASGMNNGNGRFADGKHSGNDYWGLAEVGELGPELQIHRGMPFLVGVSGRTQTYVEPGDRIYTAAETQKILQTNPTLQDIPGFSRGYGNGSWGSSPSTGGGGGGGRGRAGGGGGGGRGHARTKEFDPERYHLITRQLENLEKEFSRVDKVMEKAFGKNKIKMIDNVIEAQQKLIEAQHLLIDEVNDYVKIDKQALEDLGIEAQFDQWGNLLNFEELQEKYGRKASENSDDEEAQKKWKAIQKYEETVKKLYDEQEKLEDYIMELAEKQLEKFTAEIEMKVDFDDKSIDVLEHFIDKINDDIYATADAFQLVGAKIETTNHKISSSYEGIQKILDNIHNQEGEMINTYENYEAAYLSIPASDETKKTEAIANYKKELEEGTKEYYKLNQETKEFIKVTTDEFEELIKANEQLYTLETNNLGRGVLIQQGMTLADFLSLTPEERDALQLNSDDMEAIVDEVENILKYTEELEEEKGYGLERLSDAYEKLNGNLEDNIELFSHYNSLLSSIQSIKDLTGQGLTPQSQALTRTVNKALIDNARNNLQSQQDYYRILKESTDQMRMLLNNETDKSLIEQYKEELADMEDALRDAEEDMLSIWQDGLQAAQDAFTASVEIAGQQYDKMIADLHGNLDMLQSSYERRKEIATDYLDDYEKYYNLRRLERDLNETIDNLTVHGMRNNKNLTGLLKQINTLQKEGTELSQHDIEVLQKKYELEKARAELEEMRDAKSIIRLQRDRNGNWGYVYTQDEDNLAKLEQAVEDKLYELQKANDDYIKQMSDSLMSLQNDMSDQMLEIMNDMTLTEQEKRALIEELNQDFLTQQEYLFSEINKAMDEQGDTYSIAIDRYKGKTSELGDAFIDLQDNFEETILSQVLGITDLEEYKERMMDAWETLLHNTTNDLDEYYATIEKLNNTAGTSTEDFAEEATSWIDAITKASDKATEQTIVLGDEFSSQFKRIAQEAEAFESQYRNMINNIVAWTEPFVAQMTNITGLMNDAYDLSGVYETMVNSSLKQQNIDNLITTQAIEEALSTAMTDEEIQDILNTINVQALRTGYGLGSLTVPSAGILGQTVQQVISITAEFPDAVYHNEIEEAFNNLANKASQYANTKGIGMDY